MRERRLPRRGILEGVGVRRRRLRIQREPLPPIGEAVHVGATAILLGPFLRRSAWRPLTLTCALAIHQTTMGKRVSVVVPSQVNGMLFLLRPDGVYNPTGVEFAVMTRLLALGSGSACSPRC